MSTEARAPVEEVEGLASELDAIATRPTPDGATAGTVLASRDLLNHAAATLRDLDRKLEEAEADYYRVNADFDDAIAQRDAAEAALEEARRERDEAVQNMTQWRKVSLAPYEEFWSARVDRLVTYAAHTPDCAVPREPWAMPDPACTCGLTDLLRALSPQPHEPATEGEEGT